MSNNGEPVSLRAIEIVGGVVVIAGIVFWYATPGDVIVPPIIVIVIGVAIAGIAHLMQKQIDKVATERLVEQARARASAQQGHLVENSHPTQPAVPATPTQTPAVPATPTANVAPTPMVAPAIAATPAAPVAPATPTWSAAPQASTASILAAAPIEPVLANEQVSPVSQEALIPTPPWAAATQAVGVDADAQHVMNPATSAHELARITAERPELRGAIRSHPNAYEGLVTWIDQISGRR